MCMCVCVHARGLSLFPFVCLSVPWHASSQTILCSAPCPSPNFMLHPCPSPNYASPCPSPYLMLHLPLPLLNAPPCPSPYFMLHPLPLASSTQHGGWGWGWWRENGRTLPTSSTHTSLSRWPFIPPYMTSLLPKVMAAWLSRGDGVVPSKTGHCHWRDVPSLISSINTSLRYLVS